MSQFRRMLPGPQPYDRLYAHFEWGVPERFNIAHQICDRWAKSQPDRLAILHKQPGASMRRVTYGELREAANRLANVLKAAGIGWRDRVALLLPQRPETAIVHIAVYKLGAVTVPLASLFGPEAIEYRLGTSGARAIVTDGPGLARLKAVRENLPGLETVICVDGGEGEALDFEQCCAGHSPEFETADTGPDDWATMVFTSGTTGPPKGALHAQRVLLGHLPGVEFSHDFFPREGDLMWTPADWAWAGGLFNVMFPALNYGVPLLAFNSGKFDAEAAFGLMEEAGVRNAFIPPTALRMLRGVERPAKRFNLGLRSIASGGEALGRETLDWGRSELGLTINEFYGQTECNYVLASCAAIGVIRAGAIGKAVPGHVVAVIDAEGRALPHGKQGQIAVRTPDPNLFLEYWGNPEATRDKFIGEWMTTGDQGVMDEDGYISFVGRDDDVITSAGFRIGPGEIEDCLLRHPAVRLAAAVGKPDELRTEIVKAFIVLNDGYERSPELEKDLGAFVRERLSAHEYPREITFIEEMPLTTTGKVIRRLLRDRA